jgi:cytosine/adenosine deaminase-related metal-dependent hydrolase
MITPQDSAHIAHFFDADEHLMDAASQFIREGIESGCTCVALATAAHREGIDARLATCGLNPATLESGYQYIPLDARAMLANFMSDRVLDRPRFHDTIGLLMRQAAARGQPVRIFGEMVAVLIEQGSLEVAIELEELWNELSRQQTFLLLCGFPSALFSSDAQRTGLKHLCAVHSRVIGTA